ncbi:tryptophan--tRNA ligase [Flexivirga caeni]|uniref:Tryptophan--tRNA ligase n=1 Tax=Flexivirga caeni TaxID=2294115 RepID=A0A3M9M590_9MICO|nr:tryptophan--tRNA ligase [Flexivirga caeni]RNI20335.1 tryptophan--tRNA ligase [Flexivirga caeni]
MTVLDDTELHTDASYAASFARSRAVHELIDDPASAERTKLRVLTGDRPTGPLHIGHLFATLKSRVAIQNKGIDTFILVADYQVITDRDAVGDVRAATFGQLADYLAAGIDPARSTIFAHSAVPEIGQLTLVFLSLVTDAELRRNPTVKDELAATDGRPLSGLLLSYPVHQAADILGVHGTVVPVGRDQLPHIEQTRAIARRFNTRYSGGEDYFRAPDALLTEMPVVPGLDGRKMSTSRGNGVSLGMTADETAARIRKARTDSERRITFEPERRPEVASMLRIAGLFTGEAPEHIADRIGDGGAAALKAELTTVVNDGLAAHRARRADLAADPAHLESVLREGNTRAREIAARTLDDVNDRIGVRY